MPLEELTNELCTKIESAQEFQGDNKKQAEFLCCLAYRLAQFISQSERDRNLLIEGDHSSIGPASFAEIFARDEIAYPLNSRPVNEIGQERGLLYALYHRTLERAAASLIREE